MDLHLQHVDKRVREEHSLRAGHNGENGTSSVVPAAPIKDDSTPPATAAITMDKLPTVALSHISSFIRGGNLSGACKSTLEAIPELHYRISIIKNARSFSVASDPSGSLSSGHMGLQPSGALASGRVVTRVTVTGCTDRKNTDGGYQILEKAVQRVVRHSIPTLRSITVAGRRGKDSGRVAAIVGVLVPNAAKLHRVVPRLVKVEIQHGANGIVKVGNAMAARLWPALEELSIPSCHGNIQHFSSLSSALRSGCAPKLRVLNWDNQCCGKEGVDDSVLSALCAGKCPHIETLSFTNSYYLSEVRLDFLRGAIQACRKLRELRMDCTSSPRKQLRDLAAALHAGDMPCLTSLLVRLPSTVVLHALEDEGNLRKAVESRATSIRLEIRKAYQ